MKSTFGKVSSKSILKILSYLSIFKILFQTIFILYLQDSFEKYLAQHWQYRIEETVEPPCE